MNLSVFVVHWDGLGPAKFFIFMSLWLAFCVWSAARSDR